MTHFELQKSSMQDYLANYGKVTLPIIYYKTKKEVFPVTSKRFLSILFPSGFNPYIEIRSLLIDKNRDLLPVYKQLRVNIVNNENNFITRRHKKDLNFAFRVTKENLEIFRIDTWRIIHEFLDNNSQRSILGVKLPEFAELQKEITIPENDEDDYGDCSNDDYDNDDFPSGW